MEKSEIKNFILELLLIIFLFFVLFTTNIITRNILAIFLFIYMIIVSLSLKKRTVFSMYKKQVTFMMVVFALLYLALFYFLGLYFGFKMAKILLSIKTILKIIFPLIIIIISSEVIRKIFLAQRINFNFGFIKGNITGFFTFISMVLIDLVVYINIYNLHSLEEFWEVLSHIVFASLSCNLLYNYISNRFGSIGIIIYRLIICLYVYVIPIVPDIYIFFDSFFRMLYPYLIYVIIENKYTDKYFVISYGEKKRNFIINIIMIVVMTLLIMLISCQFRYGILVVGSDSMKNTINVGDAIIYKSYKDEIINKGQVIVFNYNGIKTIHRVVDIKNVNGEYRFYTKGDANSKMDLGYRIKAEIDGVVISKVKYVGYPTLWVRELFS